MVTLIDTRKASRAAIRLEDFAVSALDNVCVYCNLAKTNPVFSSHLMKDVYQKRVSFTDPIELCEIDGHALLYGDLHFVVEVSTGYLREQYPPYIGPGRFVESLDVIVAPPRPLVEVEAECLMVGRYGVSTWGHWFGELLPKILLAERACPGRFLYVLPSYAIDGLRPNSIWSSIQQSLAACGVDSSRVYAVDPTNNYRFSRLFAVGSLWSDHVMHPAVATLVRRHLAHIEPKRIDKLAIRRHAMFGRQIANGDEVFATLERHGYTIVESGLLPFEEQIALFKGAKHVFSVLGSDLTNLVASPEGVKVLSAAPDNFGDRFFYALILERKGRLADLRGAIVSPNDTVHKATFHLAPEDLAAALSALETSG